MARVYDQAYFGDGLRPVGEANLSVASSAVLYGLSVYTVFPVSKTDAGLSAFRLEDHYRRLVNSARIIGIDTFEPAWSYDRFASAVREVVRANAPGESVFARATVHVDAPVPGTRSRGLPSTLSVFLYEAAPIVPQDGARLKTSVWRRVPDYAIPSRAKVNGAYVNSVLAKQDAIDSGYDDCVLLDASGHVCELSAANIFIARGGRLVTPPPSADILEGITRRTVIDLAPGLGVPVDERAIDMTELFVADEVFACGTSSFVAPVKEIDARRVGDGTIGPVTARVREAYARALGGEDAAHRNWLTPLV